MPSHMVSLGRSRFWLLLTLDFAPVFQRAPDLPVWVVRFTVAVAETVDERAVSELLGTRQAVELGDGDLFGHRFFEG